MNVTALFAGIAGFEVGLAQAGHRTTLLCESDPSAVAVLRSRFPEVPISLDVRRSDELRAMIDPASDLLTAGFPCTDLSQAGKTAGFAGKQSSLIRDVLRLLAQRPFANLLIENVPNWRLLHAGQYLSEVVGELERLGYRWAYRLIDARAFGLPQRRLRLFLFASLDIDPTSVLFHGEAEVPQGRWPLEAAAHGFYWTEGLRGLGWGENCVPTLKGGSTVGIPAPPAILTTTGQLITPDIRDAERLQGLSAGWTAPALQQKRRWVMVGNAVNPRVSRWLGERLASPRPWDEGANHVLGPEAKWPAAAWFDGQRRRGLLLSPWPVAEPAEDLQRFLQHQGKLLSARATAGFLTRLQRSSLRRTPGFDQAVERHLRFMERLESEVPARAVA